MGRKIIAIVVGLVVGMVVITLMEGLSHKVFDIANSPNPKDKASFKTYVDGLSMGAQLSIPIAYLLGAVGAARISLLIAKASHVPSFICGAILTVLTAINVFFIPHPLWLSLLSLAAPIVGTLIGIKIGKTNSPIDQLLDHD